MGGDRTTETVERETTSVPGFDPGALTGTEVALLAPQETPVTTDIEHAFTTRQKALIAQTVAKDANGEQLLLFLSYCVRYNLDPFTGEVWCIATRGENGGAGRIAIIVGEQGWIKMANRYPDFRGMRSDTVCENDRFLRLGTPVEMPGLPGMFTYVEHSYGHPKDRGEITGAWTEVYREGRAPTYFYAPLAEYLPRGASDKAQLFIPWFKTESRMIQKCSNSNCLRVAFNLAGLYGAEEMAHVERVQAPSQEGPGDDEVEWGETEDTAARMRSLFAAANNAKAGSYPAAKIRLMMAGIADEDRFSLAAKELIPFIRNHGGTVPDPGDEVVGDDEVEVQHEPEPFTGDEGDSTGEDALPVD